MALFKILRGESVDLSNLTVTDGFAYFTPENGKFYIDYGNSGDAAITGRSSTDFPMKLNPDGSRQVPNRICINDTSLLTPVDDFIGSVSENIKVSEASDKITVEDGHTRLDFPDLMADLLYQKRLIGLQVFDNGIELVPEVHYTCDDSYAVPQIVFDYIVRNSSILTVIYDVQYIYVFDQLFKLKF